MAGRGGGGGRKVLLPPINFIFKLLQQRSTVAIWLYEQLGIRIEGKLRVCAHSSHCCALLMISGIRRIHEPRYRRCSGSQACDEDRS